MDNQKRFEHILSPINIGTVEIKNRFCMGPMGLPQAFGPRREFTDDAIEFFVERAKGGFGMIIQGAQQADDVVDPEIGASPLGFKYEPGLYRKQLLKMNERVEAYGTKVFAQISAGLGRNYPGFRAPSAVECYQFSDQKGIEMTKDEIRKKVDAVVALAKIEQNCGYSGVEIHAMHWGYLLDEFAMSIMNHRQDEYGGSLENRMRMAKEIITGIKQECGDNFPVLMRLGLKSYIKGLNQASFDGSDEAGRTIEEGIAICKLLEQYGCGAIDMDMGIYDSFYYACPPSYIPQGYAVDLYAQAKKEIQIPVLAGSRMQDVLIAEDAIAAGKIDGVVLTRPGLADPDLPKKVRLGKPEKIRPCIACCQCFARGLDDDQVVTCAVNPEAFKEREKPCVTTSPKKVMIVGAGAAGMQAALTAKECGHQPEIYEKSDKCGGLMISAGAQGMKKEIRDLIAWYEGELKDRGIPVHFNTEVTADLVKKVAPDALIFSANAAPVRLKFIPGTDKPFVYDCVQALSEGTEYGKKVVVIGGGHVGCEVATELAINRGKDVTIIEMADALMSVRPVPTPVKKCLIDMTQYYGIDVRLSTCLQEVKDGAIVVKNSAGETETIKADHVVIAAGFKSKGSFFHDLDESGVEVYEIGNGSPTANILESTREAYEIATHL